MPAHCINASTASRAVILTSLAGLMLLLTPQARGDDALADAERLLRVSEAGSRFESRAQQQASALIYQYTVIVNRNTDYRLPGQLQDRIAACYDQAYRWENFSAGIARILADNFSREELQLLIDFHRNLGLPPNKISLFEATVAKAGRLSELSASYIFNAGHSCVDQDVELILEHLEANAIELTAL